MASDSQISEAKNPLLACSSTQTTQVSHESIPSFLTILPVDEITNPWDLPLPPSSGIIVMAVYPMSSLLVPPFLGVAIIRLKIARGWDSGQYVDPVFPLSFILLDTFPHEWG
jgi:hypothetical protein